MTPALVIGLAVGYVGLLFAVAYGADRRARSGRSVVSHPAVYTLSMAVYCTGWTFFGSVGRAASGGVEFLTIYLGPTLLAVGGWVIWRKMIRISTHQRLTSIADFLGARYGKSARLASLATVVAVVGVVPYIALQLKAVAAGYAALTQFPHTPPAAPNEPFYFDTAFYCALALAAFTILFGTRHLDVTERHEGLVAAIAFESVVKLVAFVAVGVFVTFGLYDGFGALFEAGAAVPSIRALYTMGAETTYGDWFWLTGLALLAVLLLPRQFQVTVVENTDADHVRTAAWGFPLYLLVINLFVLPIAVAGQLAFGPGANADMFVLTLPLAEGQTALALLAFIGGLSAATGMVIVEATALSTMICNDLVLPLLLRVPAFQMARRRRLTGVILGIRRVAILAVLLLGYLYVRSVVGTYALVSIGLISFAAVAQLAPAMLGGLFWTGGTRYGALAGLAVGFGLWGYTLPLPTLAEAGWLPLSFITDGPWGVALLKPYALLGLDTMGHVPHALFWSLGLNALLYVSVSIATRPSVMERTQAERFVHVFDYASDAGRAAWRGTAAVAELRRLLRRYLGWREADRVLHEYADRHGLALRDLDEADEALVHFAERVLAGVLGASSARVVIASVVREQPLRMEEVIDLLDEAQQMVAYNRELQQKRHALEQATRKLQEANAELRAIDRLKDDFVATVTHELRTPLTAIRAISEIMHTAETLAPAQRQQFAHTILRETERLTRLVNQVLDLQRLDADAPLPATVVDLNEITADALDAMRETFARRNIACEVTRPVQPTPVTGDADQLTQVVLNLLSNAAKFADDTAPHVALHLRATGEHIQLAVTDNGPGLHPDDQDAIFQKFRQVERRAGTHAGSGLGLAITRQIVHRHTGDVWVESTPGHGATFVVRLPQAASHRAPSSASPSPA